jgi:hypothetical protein
MSTPPRLLRESWKRSRGKRAPSHCARRQKIVPPPASPRRELRTVCTLGNTILSPAGCGSFWRRALGVSSQSSALSPRHEQTNSFVQIVEYAPMLEPWGCQPGAWAGRGWADLAFDAEHLTGPSGTPDVAHGLHQCGVALPDHVRPPLVLASDAGDEPGLDLREVPVRAQGVDGRQGHVMLPCLSMSNACI